MPRRTWIGVLTIWPGLAQVWTGQEVLGLILAILFAATLDLAIVARWIWIEAFAPGWSGVFATLAILTWVASFAYTLWWVWLCHPQRFRQEIERLFRDAMEAYLQGRWNDSRKRIERILAIDETDADALLQLGTLHVRLHQPALARRAFRQCLELEGGAKWRWEIEQALDAIGWRVRHDRRADRPGDFGRWIHELMLARDGPWMLGSIRHVAGLSSGAGHRRTLFSTRSCL